VAETLKISKLTTLQVDYLVACLQKPEWLGNQPETYVLKCGFHPTVNLEQGFPLLEKVLLKVKHQEGQVYALGESGVWIRGKTLLDAGVRLWVYEEAFPLGVLNHPLKWAFPDVILGAK